MVLSCVLGCGHLTLEHNGSDIILNCLQSSRGTKVGLLRVSWSQGGSYLQFLEQKLLHALITKLTSYYLNQNFPTLESPISLRRNLSLSYHEILKLLE